MQVVTVGRCHGCRLSRSEVVTVRGLHAKRLLRSEVVMVRGHHINRSSQLKSNHDHSSFFFEKCRMQNAEWEECRVNDGAMLRVEFFDKISDIVQRSFPSVITP